jgi:hypothetical protein
MGSIVMALSLIIWLLIGGIAGSLASLIVKGIGLGELGLQASQADGTAAARTRGTGLRKT